MLAFALLATGCGGDDELATTTPPVATPAPAAAGQPSTTVGSPGIGTTTPNATTPPAASEEVPGVNEISGTDAASGTPVKISAITPKAFAKAHCRKPIMVVLYQPGSILDESLLDEAKRAKELVDDTVLLVYTPKDVKRFGDLPSKLGLLATPGLATVSRSGEIENFWTTYVDFRLIERSLQGAAAAKPCKVSGDTVPAPGSALSNAASLVSGATTATATPANGTPVVEAAATSAAPAS